MNGTGKKTTALSLRLLLVALLTVMVTGLAYAILSLPLHAPGLSVYTTKYISVSGVSNPVTAVLLNYRAYDTFLELGVLLLALLGVWSLGRASYQQRSSSLEPVLGVLSHLLMPLLIMLSGYLLWAGAHAPGGAFQAGSVLGAAGVLLLLTGWRIGVRLAGLPLRIALVMGVIVFVVVGVVAVLAGGQLLEFSPATAGAVILLIEAVATLSIGVSLAALFMGGEPTKIR